MGIRIGGCVELCMEVHRGCRGGCVRPRPRESCGRSQGDICVYLLSSAVVDPTVIASAREAGEVLHASWFSLPAATTV